MVTETPQIGLGSCQTRAMDTGLLACANTNDGSPVSICYAVRLCIFQSESGDDEVGESLLRELQGIPGEFDDRAYARRG